MPDYVIPCPMKSCHSIPCPTPCLCVPASLWIDLQCSAEAGLCLNWLRHLPVGLSHLDGRHLGEGVQGEAALEAGNRVRAEAKANQSLRLKGGEGEGRARGGGGMSMRAWFRKRAAHDTDNGQVVAHGQCPWGAGLAVEVNWQPTKQRCAFASVLSSWMAARRSSTLAE